MRVEDDELFETARQEFRTLYELKHDNIIRMDDIFYNALHKRAFLVMELIEGKNLSQIGNLSLSEIKKLFK